MATSLTEELLYGGAGQTRQAGGGSPDVRKKLLESRVTGVTLSPSEVRQLLKMIESGPFYGNGKPFLTAGDASTLGLPEIGRSEEVGFYRRGERGEFEHGEEERKPDHGSKQPVFGTEAALIAPDCTPGWDAPIPQSALNALQGAQELVEVPPQSQEPRQTTPQAPHAPRPQPSPTPRPPQTPSRPPTPTPEGSGSVSEAINRVKKRRLEEQERKRASAAMSRSRPTAKLPAPSALMGPSDDLD